MGARSIAPYARPACSVVSQQSLTAAMALISRHYSQVLHLTYVVGTPSHRRPHLCFPFKDVSTSLVQGPVISTGTSQLISPSRRPVACHKRQHGCPTCVIKTSKQESSAGKRHKADFTGGAASNRPRTHSNKLGGKMLENIVAALRDGDDNG